MPISDLVDQIEGSRQRFLELIGGLDPEDTTVPIGDGRWSPLEYLEHLVRAEEVTVWRMFKAVEDAHASLEMLQSSTPESSIEEIVGRTWALHEKAPPLAVPSLGASLTYWSVRMRRNSALVAAFADLVDESELE